MIINPVCFNMFKVKAPNPIQKKIMETFDKHDICFISAPRRVGKSFCIAYNAFRNGLIEQKIIFIYVEKYNRIINIFNYITSINKQYIIVEQNHETYSYIEYTNHSCIYILTKATNINIYIKPNIIYLDEINNWSPNNMINMLNSYIKKSKLYVLATDDVIIHNLEYFHSRHIPVHIETLNNKNIVLLNPVFTYKDKVIEI